MFTLRMWIYFRHLNYQLWEKNVPKKRSNKLFGGFKEKKFCLTCLEISSYSMKKNKQPRKTNQKSMSLTLELISLLSVFELCAVALKTHCAPLLSPPCVQNLWWSTRRANGRLACGESSRKFLVTRQQLNWRYTGTSTTSSECTPLMQLDPGPLVIPPRDTKHPLLVRFAAFN